MTHVKIYKLHCLKHVKIYKLHSLGISNKDIAEIMHTNTGHVYNVVKDYKNNPVKIEKANDTK